MNHKGLMSCLLQLTPVPILRISYHNEEKKVYAYLYLCHYCKAKMLRASIHT